MAGPAGLTRRVGRATPARWIASLLFCAAVGAFGGLLATIVGPFAIGDNSLVVMSGSMSPALRVGDVVVERPLRPSDVRVGDVVTFRDPDRAGRLLTHRVRHVRISGTRAEFETKGDANNTPEQWSIPVDGHLSRVVYRVPMLGYALVWMRSAMGRMLLVVMPVLVLGAMQLFALWRSEPSSRVVA